MISDRWLSTRRTMAAFLISLIGCNDTTPPGPLPLTVEPPRGYNNAATEIVIAGQAFHPLIFVDYNNKKRSRANTQFTANLGGIALVNVTYFSDTKLKATVPSGLNTGLWDLQLIDPRGRTGVLIKAFAVFSPPADAGPDSPADLQFEAAVDLTGVEQGVDGAVDAANPDLFVSDLPLPDLLPPPEVTTVAGNGNIGIVDGQADSAEFADPMGIVLVGEVIYICDYNNHRIRKIEGGQVTTIAGSGQQGSNNGDALSATFNFPIAIAADHAGNLFIADSSNDLIRKIEQGQVTTIAGDGTKGTVDGPALSAQFNFPRGIAVGGSTIYVADTGNHRIRVIENDVVSTFTGSSQGYADGPRGTALFRSPNSIAISGAKLFIADTGNNRIRLIEGDTVSTAAGSTNSTDDNRGVLDGPAGSAQFWNPVDLELMGDKVIIVDQTNHRLRVLDQGQVWTLSGSTFGYLDGPVNVALFYYPQGIAFSPPDQLYVTDKSNQRIRLVSF